jgi:hypothetical protein
MKLQLLIFVAILMAISLQIPITAQPTASLSKRANFPVSAPTSLSLSPRIALWGRDSNFTNEIEGDMSQAETDLHPWLHSFVIIGGTCAILGIFIVLLIVRYFKSPDRDAKFEAEELEAQAKAQAQAQAASQGKAHEGDGQGYEGDEKRYEGGEKDFEGDEEGYGRDKKG